MPEIIKIYIKYTMEQKQLKRKAYIRPEIETFALEVTNSMLGNSNEIDGQHKPIESDGEMLEAKQNFIWTGGEEFDN